MKNRLLFKNIAIALMIAAVALVSCKKKDDTVKVTGVSLNTAALSLEEGGSETLAATIAPADATNKKLSWKTSNADAATVDGSGKVTAVAAGEATITVTTEDGGKTAACAVTVAAATPLTITAHPANAEATVGGRATFTVAASGGKTPYTYWWYQSTDGGTTWADCYSPTGAKAPTMTTGALTLSSNGNQYRCRVTDADGTPVTSNAATLTVTADGDPLTIATHPANQNITVGQTATFTVAASGGKTPYTYQWQWKSPSGTTWVTIINSSSYSGVTTNKLTLSNIQVSWSGEQYRCIVTDANDATVESNAATLTVTPRLKIDAHPANQNITVGQTATFTVAASGGKTPYSYQWQYRLKNGTTWYNRSDTDTYSGTKSPTMTITPRGTNLSGEDYRCIVTDANGTPVTSNPATLTVTAALTIATHPVNASATAGGSATFTVAATGGKTPYTYQWELDFGLGWGEAGGTGSTPKTASISMDAISMPMNGWRFRCVVTDANGATVTSNAATLTVTAIVAPTGISFATPLIYTWYGKTVDLGMTVTPANADRRQITFTQESDTYTSAEILSREGSGSVYAKVAIPNPEWGALAADGGRSVRIAARLPNGGVAYVELRSKFSMRIASASDMSGSGARLLSGASISWARSGGKRYVRAYYGENAAAWNEANGVSHERYLSKIGTGNYTITSPDPAITVTKMADGITYELTRTTASVIKSVTLTVNVGGNISATQVINLVD